MDQPDPYFDEPMGVQAKPALPTHIVASTDTYHSVLYL